MHINFSNICYREVSYLLTCSHYYALRLLWKQPI